MNVLAQNVKITFSTEEPITIYLFEPLDDAYNYLYATDTLYLKPQIKVEYIIQVPDFKFIQIKSSQFGKYVFPLISGDNISLNFKKKELSISGSNADGLIYFNNNFIREGLADHIENVNEIFYKLIKTLPYSEVNRQCLNEITSDIHSNIDNLLKEQLVSERFSEIIKTDLSYAFNDRIINEYMLLLEKQPQDSINIKDAINAVYHTYPVNTPNILMHNYASLYIPYFYSKQNYQKDEDFKAYSFYLLAPPEILLPSIGKALLIDIQYGFESFNHKKVYSYLASNFPDSDYVRILRPLFSTEPSRSTVNDSDSITFITSEISFLEDLSKQELFKGKYLLIDLWASWCAPCKIEFQYVSTIHKMLKQYSDLCLLYISIDEDRFEKSWTNNINKLNLEGYHLRVNNEKLDKDIQEKVFQNGTISIPRYVLLDPKGKILGRDLPRPSSQKGFEKAIKTLISQKPL